jgi:hypothetical protein
MKIVVHGGAAIIVQSSLSHYVLPPHQSESLQAATVCLDVRPWPLTIPAVYCPPRHVTPTADYITFFRSLGSHFIVGGDWNAKHTAWGARLITPKGRNLLLPSLPAHASTIAQANLHTGRRIPTDYLTCWTS